MKIAVIGGTGLIGSQVVKVLNGSGQEAVPHSPSTGLDLLGGQGLAEALAGADVVVNVTNSPTFDDASPAFFRTTMDNLLAAAGAAHVGHAAVLSIVGADQVPGLVYYRAKVLQEDILEAGPVPYSIVHATQFFEFLRAIAQAAARGDTVHLSHALFQPMAAEDVATVVAEAALAEPVNGTLEIAGPDTFHMDEIVGRVLEYDKSPRKVVRDPEALYYGVKLDDQSLLPGPSPHLGSIKFDWWLTHVPAPQTR